MLLFVLWRSCLPRALNEELFQSGSASVAAGWTVIKVHHGPRPTNPTAQMLKQTEGLDLGLRATPTMHKCACTYSGT